MNYIQETPTKRRKTEDGHPSQARAYDSQDDSGDDLFQGHETVATVPLPTKTIPRSDSALPPSSPPPYVTQPTQIIGKETPSRSHKPSIVQVVASSPAKPPAAPYPTSGPPKKGPGGALASTMAPPGTAFRLPLGVTKAPVIDLSDDEGPLYRGGPSDDESQQTSRNDIKPSTFVRTSKDSHTNGAISRFREITAGAFYKPLGSAQSKSHASDLKGSVYDSWNRDDNQTTSKITGKRSADVMANAYGNARRPIKERQADPAKARAVEDISFDDIEDFQLRVKVERMRAILPSHSILQCRNALLKRKCNYDDAVDLLTTQEPQATEVDLTLLDDDQKLSQFSMQKKNPDKPVKAPIQSIQERWTSTQIPKPTQAPPSSPLPAVEPPKQRKRLVQGRKRPTLPALEPASPITRGSSPPPKRRAKRSSADSDSAVGLKDDNDRTDIDTKVLNFFNTCAVTDLADIAGIKTEVAEVILSRKPFKRLRDIRQIASDGSIAKPTGKTARKLIGDKIVDKCIDMWTGYEAVDELVKRCQTIGQPLADEMKKWGVDAYSGSKDGELDLVNLEHASPGRDSGIGTPTSGHATDDDDGEMKKVMMSGKRPGALTQPAIMSRDVLLKDYQIVGLNWLSLLFDKKLSCILADDMGLGKTCQVIAFLAHLKEKGVKGPHIVVVPASTLENWLREFSVFCPDLEVMPYYAELKEREEVREQIRQNLESINVIVTTYGMAKLTDETKFLRKLSPVVCVYDEGHYLKNNDSTVYQQLLKIPAQFRLLLTGTPLQNNLRELVSLLGFILPLVFAEHRDDLSYIFSHKAKTTDDSHAALLSAQRIARAKAMMTPFVLRRKKHQVLKHLPAKTCRVEYCQLSASQTEIYEAEKQRAQQIIYNRAAGIKTGNESANIIMSLRKASIHPLLFRRLYTDATLIKMSKACLREPQFAESNPNLVFEDMQVMTDHELHVFCQTYPTTMSPFLLPGEPCLDSGKITALTALLKSYIANGDRVLIFSQFVLVLNLLVPVLESLGIEYSRLDGSTPISTRQPLIDAFTYSDEPIPVFLLSTKAGGAGINLACANKVVIFDSSFNPQDDIQAENRAHRVGQKRDVEVVRLVTRGTVEEAILALGETKVALDNRVAGVTEGDGDNKKAEKEGLKKVEEMLFGGLIEGGKEKEKETEKEGAPA